MKYLKYILLFMASCCWGGTVGTYTSLTNVNINWASVSFGNELVTVANEIASVVSWAPSTGRGTNEVGENAASGLNTMTNRWTIHEMQDMIISTFDDLWHGTNTLEGATNYYAMSALGGGGTYERTFYIADFYRAAGISSNGFRRAFTNYPTVWTDLEDAHYTFGTINLGDIVGPWNVDDIQRCFDIMTQQVAQAVWYDAGYPETNSISGNERETNWAGVVATVNTEWSNPIHAGTVANKRPKGYSRSIWSVELEKFNLTAFRSHNEARATPVGIGMLRTVDFYARSEDYPLVSVGKTPSSTFANNGDDVLQDQWHLWSSINYTPTSVTHYAYSLLPLGDSTLSIPTLASEPATNTTDSVGWYLQSKFYKNTSGADSDKPVAITTYEWSYTRE